MLRTVIVIGLIIDGEGNKRKKSKSLSHKGLLYQVVGVKRPVNFLRTL